MLAQGNLFLMQFFFSRMNFHKPCRALDVDGCAGRDDGAPQAVGGAAAGAGAGPEAGFDGPATKIY